MEIVEVGFLSLEHMNLLETIHIIYKCIVLQGLNSTFLNDQWVIDDISQKI
jgi:hypothetical protein